MGRPSTYKPEFARQAERLALLGATDREVAEFFEVSESTVHQWKIVYPEFSEALKVGKETADNRVVQSLYRRATGYSYDAVKIFKPKGENATIVPYVEHVPPDTTACIFWLKNRDKANWRDKVEHELSGKGGFALTITEALPGEAIPPTPTATGKHDDER